MATESSEFSSSFIKLDMMDKHLSHFDPTALCEQRLDAAQRLGACVCVAGAQRKRRVLQQAVVEAD